MATEGPSRAGAPSLTSLPQVEDIPRSGDGLDPERTREAFDAFRRHVSQLQAQLRVLQAAGRNTAVEPSGHAVRMDALHLIRAAAEFADTIERDAQNASAAQLGRTEEEVRRRQRELQERQAEIERFREESERQRNDVLNAAKSEARELLTPRLSSLWLGLVTPVYARVGRELIAGLKNRSVVTDPAALTVFPISPIDLREAIGRAIRNEG